jgi:hypothetical protein
MLAAEGSAKLDFFMEKLRVEIRRAKVSMRVGWTGLQHRLSPNGDSVARRAKLADIYEDELTRFDIQPYPGELTLFIAERHLAGFDVPFGGWKEIARDGVRLYSLPFSPRGSLVEPYVRQLASILRNCIDYAIKESRSKNESTINPRGHALPLNRPEASVEDPKVEAHT